MAFAYEDEDRKRRALLGQMGEEPPLPGSAAPPLSGQAPTVSPETQELPGIVEGEDAPNQGLPPGPVLPTEPPLLPGDDREQPPSVPPGTQPQSDYTKQGKYKDRLGAWSGNEKFNTSWDQMSERYKMLTVLSNFDPNQGITPEVLAALNAAGIHGAQFSGQRDKLNVNNAGGWERFGKGGVGDVIEGFNDPSNTNKQWGPWNEESGETTTNTPGSDYAGTSSGASSTDYPPEMQAALNNGLVPTDNAYFMKLMEQMRQQSGTPDRKALLSLMKQ